MTERPDHIGFDPVIWINRLMNVNEGSQFTTEQRATIAAGLMLILQRLEAPSPIPTAAPERDL